MRELTSSDDNPGEQLISFFQIEKDLLLSYNAMYVDLSYSKHLLFQSEEDMTLFLLKFL